MTRWLRIVIASVLMVTVTKVADADQTVLIRRGTSMSFEMERSVDASTARRGDAVPLRLTKPLIVDGVTVLPAGFETRGHVTFVVAPGACTSGLVDWRIDRMQMPTERSVLVQRMFVPANGVIPDQFPAKDLSQRGLPEFLKTLAVLPVGALVLVWLIVTGPFRTADPFLPQSSGSTGCASYPGSLGGSPRTL